LSPFDSRYPLFSHSTALGNGRFRQIAPDVSAALASGVLEVEQLASLLTLEQLH
jgi:hypothetical protein